MTWGDEEIVRERFAARRKSDDRCRFEETQLVLPRRRPAEHLFEIFRDYYGPTMNAFAAAAKDGREAELDAQLRELFVAQNRGGERTEIPATFLKITVEKR